MRRTLDTEICSYILRRRPESILERFDALSPDQVWLSAIAAAELRLGALKLGASHFSDTIEAWLTGFETRPWPLAASHH